jgi:hypothetical protein
LDSELSRVRLQARRQTWQDPSRKLRTCLAGIFQQGNDWDLLGVAFDSFILSVVLNKNGVPQNVDNIDLGHLKDKNLFLLVFSIFTIEFTFQSYCNKFQIF